MTLGGGARKGGPGESGGGDSIKVKRVVPWGVPSRRRAKTGNTAAKPGTHHDRFDVFYPGREFQGCKEKEHPGGGERAKQDEAFQARESTKKNELGGGGELRVAPPTPQEKGHQKNQRNFVPKQYPLKAKALRQFNEKSEASGKERRKELPTQ